MKQQMPEFSLPGYRQLLLDLTEHDYELRTVGQMADPVPARAAYLRHDIDLHVPGVERMAELEAELGARATYYVLLTQHYNPMYPENRAALRRIAALGHEIGLHYDLTTYPTDDVGARTHLQWEVDLLSAVVGVEVRTISMHQPSAGQDDVLRGTDDFVHPHDPRLGADLLYVSDSCRAWRDETLLRCFGPDAPRRLLLLAHPEVWLDGEVRNRTDYLEQVLLPNTVAQHEAFITETVRGVWASHPGPRQHDARIAGEVGSTG